MACPYRANYNTVVGSEDEISQRGVNKVKEDSVTYNSYLQISRLLDCQKLVTVSDGLKHDEHLFIITHQAYELWFKQVLFEIDSIRELFMTPYMDERTTLLITRRLNRVVLIFKVLVDQFNILETMTPHDFMSFRDYLKPASGFQSLQFRLLENRLGLKEEFRVRYNQQHYRDVFHDDPSLAALERSISEPSLLELVERWLERTPGLDKDFNFWEKYKTVTLNWINQYFLEPAENEENPEEKKIKMDDYYKQKECFDSIVDEDIYNEQVARGERRLSHEAFQGAMMISLYRNEPRFHQPFEILTLLMDVDSLLTKWRYNHVMMVQRMIGGKMGTGGSSGYHYLRSTVSDRYKVFVDLFNLSTYLIPEDIMPPLTDKMKSLLSIVASSPDEVDKVDIGKVTISEDQKTQENKSGPALENGI